MCLRWASYCSDSQGIKRIIFAMKNAYYLIASLPVPKWGVAPPMTLDDFFELCSDFLSKKEKSILEKTSLMPTEGKICSNNSLAEKWSDGEIFLRNRIARIRAKNKAMNAEKNFRSEHGFYSNTEKNVQTALAMDNPFEKEKMLYLHRWKVLEDLSALSQFNFDALLAYKLKLELLEKVSSMNRETGIARFKEIRETILKTQELS